MKWITLDLNARVGHLEQERDTEKMLKLFLLATPRKSWKDLNLNLDANTLYC